MTRVLCRPLCTALLAAGASCSILVDMVQNNPGDSVGWQQTKYRDPAVLKELGYTAQAATGEMSGTQAVDFHTLGQDFFPKDSKQRAWLDAYAIGVRNFLKGAKAAKLEAYFFVDLIVLPVFVIEAFPGCHDEDGKIVWNGVTKRLLATLIDETFAAFPECDGWIVREGETYTFDTPYHVGNSPTDGTTDRWVDFISFLSEAVCTKHGKKLFVRSWDNWPSDAVYYLNLTSRITPHPNLYFSIKHTPNDFIRPSGWNAQIGIGHHRQIIEVELQREYEGKQAFPNYVMDGVIEGFPEMKQKIGLRDFINSTQVHGLWTWTRGGGWWGPYIHGQEEWVDLHVQVLSRWWGARGAISEAAAFAAACGAVLKGCGGARCCAALRSIAQMGADSVLHGIWGTVGGQEMWVRDDRIAGLPNTFGHWHSLNGSEALFAASLAEKRKARDNWETMQARFVADIEPELTDPKQAAFVATSLRYGHYLFSVFEAAWRVMAQAYRKESNMTWDRSALATAIADYDAAFGAYRAHGLAEPYAPSLYHDYYLCLGTNCTAALDPDADAVPPGIGATVDRYRNASA